MLFLLFFCKKGRKKGYGELCQLTQNVTWQPSVTSAIAAASMMAMPIEKAGGGSINCHAATYCALLHHALPCCGSVGIVWQAVSCCSMLRLTMAYFMQSAVVCCSLMLFLYQPRTYLASEYLPMSEASFTGSN